MTLAVLGWQATGGRFDPTVLDALEAAGYDRSFDQLTSDPTGTDATKPAPGPAPGLAGIRIDPEAGTVTLPAGTRLDPGGLAKGYTADLLCAQLQADEADGACVNVGGDLRVSGTAPHGGLWTIPVPHPHGGQAATLQLTDGAAATSSPLRRAWQAGGRAAHHLIDPHTGRPAETGILQVTVVATEARRAEVTAKAAFLAGLPDAFAAGWRPGAVAWGVVALYLLVAVQATSLARRRLPHPLWRRVHLAAFPLLVAATGHLLTAGSDRTNPAVLAMLSATLAATVFLLLYRLLHRPGHNRPGKPGPRGASPRPTRGTAGARPRPAAGEHAAT